MAKTAHASNHRPQAHGCHPGPSHQLLPGLFQEPFLRKKARLLCLSLLPAAVHTRPSDLLHWRVTPRHCMPKPFTVCLPIALRLLSRSPDMASCSARALSRPLPQRSPDHTAGPGEALGPSGPFLPLGPRLSVPCALALPLSAHEPSSFSSLQPRLKCYFLKQVCPGSTAQGTPPSSSLAPHLSTSGTALPPLTTAGHAPASQRLSRWKGPCHSWTPSARHTITSQQLPSGEGTTVTVYKAGSVRAQERRK